MLGLDPGRHLDFFRSPGTRSRGGAFTSQHSPSLTHWDHASNDHLRRSWPWDMPEIFAIISMSNIVFRRGVLEHHLEH